jgi:lipopolysaccharide transport system permease protein
MTAAITLDNDIIIKKQSRFGKALNDIVSGILMWRIWLMLGYQDIRLRYRRSSLGPFWITLSMAVTIYTLGILYSHLWKTSYKEYMLYFAAGLLIWSLIVSVVNESANVFNDAKGYLLQMHIPFTVFVLRLLVRNFIVFLHNLLAIVPLLIYFHSDLSWRALLAIPNTIFVLFPLYFVSMILAIIGLRFRDIGQLVTSLMNLAFFATPIMWLSSNLPQKMQIIVELNPFAQLIELIRAPLLGQLPSEEAYLFTGVITLFCFMAMVFFLTRYRHRIVFWL